VTPEYVLGVARQALWFSLMAAAPVLALGLVVGLGISLLQAVTQVNDMSVSFIPKLLAGGGALWVFAPWILEQLMAFTEMLLASLAHAGM
jgi:flagellar biosynthetic protein FliQ